MNLYPEYKDYNKITVTFLGYAVSNINTKGHLPERDIDNVQLQSLTIKGPNLDNASEIGATGTLTLLDYKHKIFNMLSGNLEEYMNRGGESDTKLFPDIQIEICCYSGRTVYLGHLLKWSCSYNGGVSTITVDWSIVDPDSVAPSPINGTFNTPEALIDAVKKSSGGNNLKFVYVENGRQYEDSAVSGHIKFNASSYYYNPTQIASSGNQLADVYRAIATNSSTLNGDPLHYTIEGDKFYTYSANPQNSSSASSDNNCEGLVFVQNGKWPQYYKRNDNKVAIPITNMSVNFDNSKVVLLGSMRGNFNGVQVVYNGQVATQSSNGTDSAQIANNAEASSHKNDPMTIKLDCYNVMGFAANDKSKLITIEVYDEHGIKVPSLSINAMVRSVDYDLSGAVVKASIECTNLFNLNDTTAEYTTASTQSSQSDDKLDANNSSTSASSTSANSTPISSAMNTSNVNNTDYKKYLCSEDSSIVSLSKDKTEKLVKSGEFDTDVSEFLQRYGQFTGSSRYLDISFVNNIISNGNYGLLTLLIAVANYGITGAPASWNLDAVNLDPGYKNKKPFCASNTGKSPFDYTSGGLGIAHWDSGNLDDIYSTIGFDPVEDVASSVQRDHFKSLLVTDNSIIGWKDIKYLGIDRKAPVFSKSQPKMRYFDKGLKQDSAWLSWAKKILYYRNNDSQFIYQHYLFRLWIQKFWVPTVNRLLKKQSNSSHAIGLQDAVRISRAGNSATGLINASCGKDVETQYMLYYNDKERYMRQKAFCRRCADIIGYCN